MLKYPSSPLKITWIIGILAGLLGIVGHFGQVQFLTENSFMLLLIGFLVLAVGTTFKGV
jgi:type IV secretory pathway VirB3-like protein